MTGIILAAGLGSRLGKNNPKGLLVLPNQETILGRQVRLMKAAAINRVIIVVGFKHELIREQIPGVEFQLNARYRETNTAKSLLLGMKDINDDILWMNGDVVFDDDIVIRIAARLENTILVNKARCGEEEVKYRADENGIITEISKQVVNGHGEALGINLVAQDSVDEFRTALDESGDNDYFEHAIHAMVTGGAAFRELDIGDRNCIEIDFDEDWQQANSIFQNLD